MGRPPAGSWLRSGCLGLAGLTLIVIAAIVGTAVRQNRSTVFEHREWVQEIPEPSTPTAAPSGPMRLRLDVHTAGLSIAPVAPGEPIGIEADYDPRRYELRHESERRGAELLVTVVLQPLGSNALALLRVKLGGRPPILHIGLPRDVPLELEGRLARSFAAMELGGLLLGSTELDVREGGVKVSFVEPLAAPMDTLSIRGSKGSLSVAGLGNASPRIARFEQRVGAVDLDLRGAWVRDADIFVEGSVAGGSVWLPSNVAIEGLDARQGFVLNRPQELAQPTLSISISERLGRFVVME